MSKQNLKRLATIDDKIVHIESPIEETEIKNRHSDYVLLSPQQFAKKYRSLLFKPIKIRYKDNEYHIDYNHCMDPFCKWFGLPQKKFHNEKGKPNRYYLFGSSDGVNSIKCNEDPLNHGVGNLTFQCRAKTVSNWSIADEILRLATINQVQSINNKLESCGFRQKF